MFNFKRLATGATAAAAVLSMVSGAALAEVTIRVQSVLPSNADEVFMLQDFANDVEALTDGEVKFEILPAGSVVGVSETLDAVDTGLIDGGFA